VKLLTSLALALACAGCATTTSDMRYDLDALGEALMSATCAGMPPTAVETVPNPHVDGVMDRIEHRTCAEGASTAYVSTQASDPAGLAMSLVLHRSVHGLPAFLDFGSPASAAVAKLGVPDRVAGDTLVYVFGDFEDTLSIRAPEGKITSLAWSWTVD